MDVFIRYTAHITVQTLYKLVHKLLGQTFRDLWRLLDCRTKFTPNDKVWNNTAYPVPQIFTLELNSTDKTNLFIT